MERQNTQELYWSFDDEEHNEDSTKKSDQISTGITSRYCKWLLNFNLSVLKNKNSSFRLVQHLHWRLLVTLNHLMQMKSVKITFLQRIMEALCVLGLVQSSFWPQSYIALPPDCWTLQVLKHSKGPNSAWILRCLFLSIFPSSLHIHSGRMGTVRWPKSWVLW